MGIVFCATSFRSEKIPYFHVQYLVDCIFLQDRACRENDYLIRVGILLQYCNSRKPLYSFGRLVTPYLLFVVNVQLVQEFCRGKVM